MSTPQRRPGSSGASLHAPVLVREVLHALDLQSGQTIVDGTIGGGGHGKKILEAIGSEGTLIGMDRDLMMLEFASKQLSLEQLTQPNCHLVHDSYAHLPDALQNRNIAAVDGVLLDLGLSSDQLADDERGFGFASTGPLDLRFDLTSGKSAWKHLEKLDEGALAEIFQEFGEERFADRIAAEIVARRRGRPVRTASDLAEAVVAAIPGSRRGDSRRHPATRVFQALRIAVNNELEQLHAALDHVLYDSLRPGGRAVVISFHSLEDRMVKNAFRDVDRWQTLTTKPVTAAPAEIRLNPRARTAKLRAAIRQ
jgi:16S rRNA (cytosine1402-N4)-methyltransferase